MAFYEFNDKDWYAVDRNQIHLLKEKANTCGYHKYRLCLQHSSDDSLHEMIIVAEKTEYHRPDKHPNSPESNLILEGIMNIIIFDDAGKILDVIELSPQNQFMYRIEPGYFHMSLPVTETVVYVETKLGPFNNSTNVYPDWAPAPDDSLSVQNFQINIENSTACWFAQKHREDMK